MWRADGSDASDRLARYWDARTARRAALANLAADLDPGVIDTVVALHARDDARLPDPAFLGRLEQSLLQAIADAPDHAPAPAREHISTPAPSRSTDKRFLRFDRRSGALGHLAAAALLLFTLALGYGAVRLAPAGDLAQRFPSILATSAPTMPAGVSARTRLLRLTLTRPFAKIPPALGAWHATLAPGGYDREIGRAGIYGDQIFFVESGAVTARLLAGDQPPQLIGAGHGGAPTADAPTAGDDLRVETGEAALLPGGTTIELRNGGDADATILWILGNSSMSSDSRGLTWNASGAALAASPQLPALLTLDRATLAPNAKIAAASPPAVTTIGLFDPPFGYLLVDRDGSARNISASPRDVYILTLTPLQPATPTP